MPDDRLIHRALGHSEKINSLTDFEKLAWLMYKLASDDFGVMRFSAVSLQEAADWLENKPAKTVQRAIERVESIGLIRTFEHQGRVYCYQHDWQTWQKITHPRQTKQPAPPREALDLNTQYLFDSHPKGAKLTSWQHPSLRPKAGKSHGKDPEDSGNTLGKLPEKSVPVFVGVGSDRVRDCVSSATPSQTYTGPKRNSHRSHAMCGVVCVPQDAWDGMLKRLGGDDARLRGWVSGILDDWQRRVDGGEVVSEGDDFAFWRARWSETHGRPAERRDGERRVESAEETERLLAERRQWVS